MSSSDFTAALPTDSAAVKTLLRNSLIQRVIYPFSETEDVQAWDALDGDTGALPEAISKYGNVYALDPDDTTSVHDDATCQVTQDGYRYKVQGVALRPTSVLDKDLTTPPSDSDSPPVSLGDAYLVPAGATGDWSDFPDYIALWTARGWAFEAHRVGRLLYVEDEDSFYHYNMDGDWVAGVGQSALSPSSVKVSNFLGGGRSFHFTVINQTTNTPPTLTGGGNQYIVGSSPTGAWSGKAGYIAIDEGSAWGLYQPATGWRAFDVDQGNDYRYSGSAWVSQSGAILFFTSQFTQGTGSTSSSSTTDYSYSNTTAPTTSNRRTIDSVAITRAARSGAKLRLKYSATAIESASSATASVAVALFRDSESNAIAWQKIQTHTTSDSLEIRAEFIVVAPDASSHTYTIAIAQAGFLVASIQHRLFTLEEFA